MNSDKFLQEIKKRLTPYLEKREEITAAFLFGSMATGLTHNRSDIDIALLLKQEERAGLERELEYSVEVTNQLGGREIDLLIINRAPIVLAYRIISEGKSIYVRDEEALADFKEAVFIRYFDFKYVHETYNAEFGKEIKYG